MTKRLLIVAHAPSQNTLALRAAVERGANSAEADIAVTVKAPLEASPDDVLACQALILGTTENLSVALQHENIFHATHDARPVKIRLPVGKKVEST